MITLDFETYYDREYSLSKLTTEAYIRDPRFEVIGMAVKQDSEPAVWYTGTKDELAGYLKQYNLKDEYLLAHNTAFDGAILAWHFGLFPKYYLDTLSMSRPVTGHTVGGSLAALAKQFVIGEKGTEVVNALGKRRADFTPEELSKYGDYCINDTELTYILYKIMRQYSTPREIYLIDLLLRMFIDPVIELDADLLIDHLATVKAKKQLLLERVGVDDSLKDTLMSNHKLAKLLEQLGVEVPMKVSPAAAKRGESTLTYAFGKSDLAFKALLEHPDPRVQAIVAARLGVKSTIEETRTESLIGISTRGKLPILLNYWGAHTGRASGGDNMNLQNIPKKGKLRRALRAPADHVLIASDSSNIEARVVALLAGQDDLVQAFARGEDIYSMFASGVFDKPINKKEHPTERFVGKTCILGLGYGTGADKLKYTLKVGQPGVSVDIPLDESKRIVNLYRNTYPKIPELWKDADKALRCMCHGDPYVLGKGIQLICDGEGVHLPNGMILRYPQLRADEEGYVYSSRKGQVRIYGAKLVENIVQALARIVVFDQMGLIEQRIRPFDTPDARHRVVLTVHDEVVVCVPVTIAMTVKDMVQEVMSTAPKWAPGLPVACEVGAGDTYADCK